MNAVFCSHIIRHREYTMLRLTTRSLEEKKSLTAFGQKKTPTAEAMGAIIVPLHLWHGVYTMPQLNTRQSEKNSETFFAHSHKSIRSTERLSKYDSFLDIVTSLAKNNPEVYASDEYFAIEIGCSIRNIKRYFKKAESQGALYRITKNRRDAEGKIRGHRHVYLTGQNALTLNLNRGTLVSPLLDKHSNISPNIHNLSRKRSGETHAEKLSPENNKSIPRKAKEKVELPPKVVKNLAPPLRKTESIYKKDIKTGLKMVNKSKNDITFDKNTLMFMGITEKDKENWLKIYPDVQFEPELALASKWLADAKLKKKSIRTFLRNWISKAKEINDLKKIKVEKKSVEIHTKNKETIATLAKSDKFLLNYGLKCTFTDSGIEFEGSKYGDSKYEYLSYSDLRSNPTSMNFTMIGKLIKRGIPLSDAQKIVKDHQIPTFKISERDIYEAQRKEDERLRKERESKRQQVEEETNSCNRFYR